MKGWVYHMIKGLLAMKPKRETSKGMKKIKGPQSWNEWAMIVIFLSVVWFAWGQFQLDKHECKDEQCEVQCSK